MMWEENIMVSHFIFITLENDGVRKKYDVQSIYIQYIGNCWCEKELSCLVILFTILKGLFNFVYNMNNTDEMRKKCYVQCISIYF